MIYQDPRSARRSRTRGIHGRTHSHTHKARACTRGGRASSGSRIKPAAGRARLMTHPTGFAPDENELVSRWAASRNANGPPFASSKSGGRLFCVWWPQNSLASSGPRSYFNSSAAAILYGKVCATALKAIRGKSDCRNERPFVGSLACSLARLPLSSIRVTPGRRQSCDGPRARWKKDDDNNAPARLRQSAGPSRTGPKRTGQPRERVRPLFWSPSA